MFYSTVILTKKGTLGQIWIAAHWENKLTKRQIKDIIVSKSVQDIESPPVALSLRLTAHLLLGITRIYKKKVTYLRIECEESTARILASVNQPENVHEDLVTAKDDEINLNSTVLQEDALDFDITLDMNKGIHEWMDVEKDPEALKNLFAVTNVEYNNNLFLDTSIEQPRQSDSILNMSDIHENQTELSDIKNGQQNTITSSLMDDSLALLPPFIEGKPSIETARHASSMMQTIDNDDNNLLEENQHKDNIDTIDNIELINNSIKGNEDINIFNNDILDMPDFIDNSMDQVNRISLSLNESTNEKEQPNKQNTKVIRKHTIKKSKKRFNQDNAIEYPERLIKRRQTKNDMETKQRPKCTYIDSLSVSRNTSAFFNHYFATIDLSSSIQDYVTKTILNTLKSSNSVFEPVQNMNLNNDNQHEHELENQHELMNNNTSIQQSDLMDMPDMPDFSMNNENNLSSNENVRESTLTNDLYINNDNDSSQTTFESTSSFKQTEQVEQFRTVINKVFEEHPNEPLSWKSFSKQVNRQTAAKSFFSLLMLASENQFYVIQNEPYEDILITKST